MNGKEQRAELPDFMALWDYDRPEETEGKFKELLPRAKASGNQGYLAEILTQIARTCSLRGDFPCAHRTLDQVRPLLSDEHPRSEIRYLLERGRTFNSAGNKAEARPLFLEAWELGAASGEDGRAIDAAHMMAIVAPSDKKLAWNLKALELTEATSDEEAKEWSGSLYNNIGWTYFVRREYDKAMGFFDKALTWRQAQNQVREIQIAKWCIGRTHRALGNIEKALEIQEALYREIEEGGAEKDGYVFEELGECYFALKRPEAEPFFAQAYEYLSKDEWLVKNEPDRIRRLKELGRK